MKLSEAMKFLEENPTRKFEYKNDRKKWLLYTNVGGLTHLVYYKLDCWDNNGKMMTGTPFGSLHGNLSTSDDWQLVPQLVTWQEAIEAWVDGKKVSYSYKGHDKRFIFEGSNTVMSVKKVKDAEWYVED